MEQTASSVDNTSQSAEKSLERTAVGVDDKLASTMLEGTASSAEDTSQPAIIVSGVGAWFKGVWHLLFKGIGRAKTSIQGG